MRDCPKGKSTQDATRPLSNLRRVQMNAIWMTPFHFAASWWRSTRRALMEIGVRDSMILLGLAAVATTTYRYKFLGGQAMDDLPSLYRALDPTFLINDFYVNAKVRFSEDRYFIQFIAFLAKLAPVSMLCFALTLLAHWGIGWVSFGFGYELSGSRLGGILAGVLSLTATTFQLGWRAELIGTELSPSLMALPLALGSLWLSRRGSLAAAVFLAIGAMAFHVHVGAGAGGLVVLTAAISYEMDRRGRAAYLRCLGAGAVLVGSFLLLYGSYFADSYFRNGVDEVSDSEFVDLLIWREPHHQTPVSFSSAGQWLRAVGVFVAAGLAYRRWRVSGHSSRRDVRWILSVVSLVATACLFSFVFVELWPVRLVITAQLFRLLFVVKWLALVLIGIAVARLIEGADGDLSPLPLVASSSPLLALPVLFLCSPTIRSRLTSQREWLIGLFTAIGLLVLRKQVIGRLLVWCLLLALLVAVGRPRAFRWIALGLSGFFLVNAFRGPQLPLPRPLANRLNGYFRPAFDEWSDQRPEHGVARFMRERTPKDAVFMSPPTLGTLRILARRALVVDLWAEPVDDAGQAEWAMRLAACCTRSKPLMATSFRELANTYDALSDNELIAIAARFRAAYAVTRSKTQTSLPILYADDFYRLVKISPSTGPSSTP